MGSIFGGTTVTPMRNPDWNQTNPNRADFIKNKPDIDNAVLEALVVFDLAPMLLDADGAVLCDKNDEILVNM